MRSAKQDRPRTGITLAVVGAFVMGPLLAGDAAAEVICQKKKRKVRVRAEVCKEGEKEVYELVPGEQGPPGDQGPPGPEGAQGPPGEDAIPAGADFAEVNRSVALNLSDVPTEMAAVALAAPAPGVVVVNASSSAQCLAASTVACAVVCSIEEDASDIGTQTLVFQWRGDQTLPVTDTRAFEVLSAGTRTYRFLCEELGNESAVSDARINATFVPSRY